MMITQKVDTKTKIMRIKDAIANTTDVERLHMLGKLAEAAREQCTKCGRGISPREYFPVPHYQHRIRGAYIANGVDPDTGHFKGCDVR